jgi:hypothetical protein
MYLPTGVLIPLIITTFFKILSFLAVAFDGRFSPLEAPLLAKRMN